MKKLREWCFVGYAYKTDREGEDTLYAIAHLREDESLEDAVERAKQMVKEKFELEGGEE